MNKQDSRLEMCFTGHLLKQIMKSDIVIKDFRKQIASEDEVLISYNCAYISIGWKGNNAPSTPILKV